MHANIPYSRKTVAIGIIKREIRLSFISVKISLTIQEVCDPKDQI